MSSTTIQQYYCSCGKLFSGDVKRTDNLVRLHHKICKKSKGERVDTATVRIKIDMSYPKSQDGEKTKQQHIQDAEREISRIRK